MIAAAEIARSVAGAWRLARLDPAGIRLFEDSLEAFWRSFWAAAVVAPGYFYVVSFRIEAATDDTFHSIAVELIAYAIGWVAFPVAAHYLTQALNCGERYLLYITAYNWSAAIQVGVNVVLVFAIDSGLLPEGIATFVIFGAVFLLWFYQYFIARTALGISAAPAIALVASDELIGQALSLAVSYAHRAAG